MVEINIKKKMTIKKRIFLTFLTVFNKIDLNTHGVTKIKI